MRRALDIVLALAVLLGCLGILVALPIIFTILSTLVGIIVVIAAIIFTWWGIYAYIHDQRIRKEATRDKA